jgi:hypothetical protein
MLQSSVQPIAPLETVSFCCDSEKSRGREEEARKEGEEEGKGRKCRSTGSRSRLDNGPKKRATSAVDGGAYRP